ncbi:hypothetical protein Cni_G21310 [Canna indica]|uniref:Homeobox domain-containing protein n=1 Tax=Canna indica TaxID=4628 RepID=A0AAQ3KP96_9LILI|nr:hypothetical protein Cni_G21310 [Canna indica]
MPQAPSTRWCPTPEQLMILEELYRSGVRTPDASQIQQITTHLSCYGRIEGKNVFYWFQNHKARERQKLRRRLSCMHHQFFCSGYPLPVLPPPHRPLHFFQDDPLSPLLQYPPSHLFHQDPTQQGLNLLCKLESKGEDQYLPNSEAYASEWMATMDVPHTNPTCCKPLKTLDLFPTKSTGVKEEGNTSKSMSTSPS